MLFLADGWCIILLVNPHHIRPRMWEVLIMWGQFTARDPPCVSVQPPSRNQPRWINRQAEYFLDSPTIRCDSERTLRVPKWLRLPDHVLSVVDKFQKCVAQMIPTTGLF